MPHIEIVGYRDPDSATDIRVFIDGVEATNEVSISIVDPGAGCDLDDWKQMAEDDIATASPAAGALLRRWYDDGAQSPYVVGSGY